MVGTGNFSGRRACLVAAVAIAWTCGNVAEAGDREIRDYAVYVDGKPAGNGQITIEQRDDGTTVVTGETDVKVRVFVFKYTYSYRGQEVWKNGKLQSLASTSNDDGKKFTVNAVARDDGLHATVNGRVRALRGDYWPTSYWRLPEEKARSGALQLIDADTGRDLEARMESLGDQQISFEGRRQNAGHYRLTGKVTVDLWYDSHDRLVRQDWVEDGHRTVIELTEIRK